MATRPAVRTRSPGPRESRQVVLVFDGGTTLEVEGKRKSVFVPNQGIALRANLRPLGAPPRTALPRAIVETSWVDTASQREVLRKRFQLRDIVPEVPIVLDYSPAEMAGVPRLRDLHVRATVRWPARDGAVGVRGDHAIYLTEGTMVASFGDAVGPPQPLDDVSLHRVFWNKIWEGGVPPDEDARRFELDVLCRYYVRAAAGEPSNGRMETRIQMVPSPSGSGTARINGRMRAGIEVSVRELARLAISVGHTTPLAPRDLATLEATDLRGVMDLEATTRLRVRGKKGSMGVVWAFPAVEPRAITLLDVARTDDAGQVIEIAQRTVQLPVPSQIHFVTLRSK